MSSNAAPGALDVVRRFVNTFDAEDLAEALDSPAALARWLRQNGLADGTVRPSREDLLHAYALREALRAVLVAHHGEPLDPHVPPFLDEAARRARLAVRFDAHGDARVVAEAPGVDGALGRLLAIVHDAIGQGTWERLKVCPADDCQVAFYDRSRNRSAVWCDMKVCGNRAKARGYRARRGGAGA
ncbi:MAG TPA: CGNR zinc finger domain-containing protein [Solirubrobacteraceae bacterium]|jgi:predicted RNA-binding Zn ribbon-like protein|nr:CGNR zinc finger domain-containing protein [Solirubrobacteraceae bacterium]